LNEELQKKQTEMLGKQKNEVIFVLSILKKLFLLWLHAMGTPLVLLLVTNLVDVKEIIFYKVIL